MSTLSPGRHMSTPSGKADGTGNVSSSEIELRSVAGEEGLLTAAFLFGQNVYLTYELGMRMNGAGLAKNLTSFDLIFCNTTKQCADVVAGLCLIQKLVEHFHTGDNSGLSSLRTDRRFQQYQIP